ncbi:MAG: hypothetical protein AAB583_04575 [Patescibacteria group bacterium]
MEWLQVQLTTRITSFWQATASDAGARPESPYAMRQNGEILESSPSADGSSPE